MKKIYLFICITILTFALKAQQDPQYNLYQFNQMIINPAYAGARDGLAIIASNRQQWVGFDGAPKTTCLSIHGPVLRKNLGLGLTVTNDIMGPRNVTAIYGNVAYILKLDRRNKLSFGINGGYNRYQFNFSKISFDKIEQLPVQYLQTQNKSTLDINAGVYLKGKSYFVGLSATHINAPDISYRVDTSANSKNFTYKLRSHLFLTGGYSFKISDNAIFAPTVLIKEVNGVAAVDINANFFLYKKLWLGAFYRAGYGPGALLQYYITNQFRVAYSYDTGMSDARRLGGSHEVMIGFDFAGTKNKMINPRFL